MRTSCARLQEHYGAAKQAPWGSSAGAPRQIMPAGVAPASAAAAAPAAAAASSSVSNPVAASSGHEDMDVGAGVHVDEDEQNAIDVLRARRAT